MWADPLSSLVWNLLRELERDLTPGVNLYRSKTSMQTELEFEAEAQKWSDAIASVIAYEGPACAG